ncbi:hypothetical protein ACFSL4_26345, partial [Streptomyces caeni]
MRQSPEPPPYLPGTGLPPVQRPVHGGGHLQRHVPHPPEARRIGERRPPFQGRQEQHGVAGAHLPPHQRGHGGQVVGPVRGVAIGLKEGELRDQAGADGEHAEQGDAVPPTPCG